MADCPSLPHLAAEKTGNGWKVTLIAGGDRYGQGAETRRLIA